MNTLHEITLKISIPASHNYFEVSSTRLPATDSAKELTEFSKLPAGRAGH
jgi:hypothetical protein